MCIRDSACALAADQTWADSHNRTHITCGPQIGACSLTSHPHPLRGRRSGGVVVSRTQGPPAPFVPVPWAVTQLLRASDHTVGGSQCASAAARCGRGSRWPDLLGPRHDPEGRRQQMSSQVPHLLAYWPLWGG